MRSGSVAFMLTPMFEPSTLLREARARAGLSTRELAGRAGMSASTVSRIELGTIDPTFGTLQRLMASAGAELVLQQRQRRGVTAAADLDSATPPASSALSASWTAPQHAATPAAALERAADGIASTPDLTLADLHDAWRSTPRGPRPDWTRLRAFLERLDRHPELIAAAIRSPPRRTRSAMMNALLAGIADKLADDSGLSRPSWTRAAGGLKRCWYSPGTPRMRAAARASAPAQLLRRNLAIREDSLWRPREPTA